MESAPPMTPDVDFHDVFGGPPRRSPPSPLLRGRADSFDSYTSSTTRVGGGGGGAEGAPLSRRRWSGVGDKPVFGDASSPAARRRHHLGDEFFSDIFQGGDSLCPTQRMGERDRIPSPGSRVRSQAASASPLRSESFVGGSSLPPQLSRSMKLGRGGEHPVVSSFGFSVPSSPIANYALNRVIPEQDQRNDVYASYRQSPLSRVSSKAAEGRGREDATCLDGQSKSSRFHFSIYKWAGKGVMLILPSNSEEKNKNGSRLRRLPELVLQGVEMSSYNDKMVTVSGASKDKSENQDIKLPKDLTSERKDEKDSTIMEGVLPAKFQFKVLQRKIKEERVGEVSFTMREEQRPKLTNLRQLLVDESDCDVGNEDIIIPDQKTEGSTKEMSDVFDNVNIEQRDGVNHVEIASPSTQDKQATTTSREKKLPGGRVKGKVKEFIKIFNQEVPVKPRGVSENQDRKTRVKDGRKGEVDVQANAHAAKTDEEIKESNRNDTVPPAALIAVSQTRKPEEPNSNMSSDAINSCDSSFQRNDNFVPRFELPPESFDNAMGNLEESQYGDLDTCLVEHLSEEQDDLQNDMQQDQIQISDVKIREWSKGKEGNIRSLLSTLQYVLWPDSGWKPVPLVDIIEGNSVKRAYQKALLCLHPDKLQQKGAALHQKYIAEKVFDILQEAWTYFCSVGPI